MSSQPQSVQPQRIEIVIQDKRFFLANAVPIQVGQSVELIVRNQDHVRHGFASSSLLGLKDKEALALKFGAMRYLDGSIVNVAEEVTKMGGASVILATAPNSKAMSDVIDGLGVRGKLLVVGASADPISVTPIQVIGNRRSIQECPSGTTRDSEDTLNFCALTGIGPMVETFPLEQAAAGYERMASGNARFPRSAYDELTRKRRLHRRVLYEPATDDERIPNHLLLDRANVTGG